MPNWPDAQRNKRAAAPRPWGAGVGEESPLGRQPKEHVVPHGTDSQSSTPRLLPLSFLSCTLKRSVSAGLRRMEPRASCLRQTANAAGKAQRARPADDTRLRSAAFAGDIETIKQLLDQDLEAVLIDRRDRKGWTALMYAAVSGNHAAAQQLVGRGADLGCKNDQGRTALDLAESRGHHRTVAYLKLCGAPGSPFAKLSPTEAAKPEDLWGSIADSTPQRLTFSPHPEVRQYEPTPTSPDSVRTAPDFSACLDESAEDASPDPFAEAFADIEPDEDDDGGEDDDARAGAAAKPRAKSNSPALPNPPESQPVSPARAAQL